MLWWFKLSLDFRFHWQPSRAVSSCNKVSSFIPNESVRDFEQGCHKCEGVSVFSSSHLHFVISVQQLKLWKFCSYIILWDVRLRWLSVFRCGATIRKAFIFNTLLYTHRTSGMLRSSCWYLFTDVWGQPVSPICKGQAVQEYSRAAICKQVPTYTAETRRRLTPRRKPEVSQVILCCPSYCTTMQPTQAARR
jgi:hypothetical protein